ncbi:MAG: hypothetical protein QX189_09475 [Methylococcales bacterium]
MDKITFSIGSYVKTPNEPLTTVSLTLAKLVDLFRTPAIIPDKLKSPYFLRCTATHRNNKSVSNNGALLIIDADKRLDWLNVTGNFDGSINPYSELDGSIEPYQVHQCLLQYGITHAIYSSYSNGATHDKDGKKYLEPVIKWRAVIPCQYPKNRLTDCVNYIIALLHENQLFVADAKENHTYSQAWFMPCVHPDRVDLFQFFSFADGDYLSIETVNQWVKEQAVLNEWTEDNNQKARLNEPTEHAARKPLATPSQTDSKSPIDAFNAAYSVHDVLTNSGYKLTENGKYLSPKSTTKEAGVIVLPDGKHIKSYHNDVLNDGYAHDAFDCYRLLECDGDKRTALNWNSEITRQNRRDYMRTKELSQAFVVECVA